MDRLLGRAAQPSTRALPSLQSMCARVLMRTPECLSRVHTLPRGPLEWLFAFMQERHALDDAAALRRFLAAPALTSLRLREFHVDDALLREALCSARSLRTLELWDLGVSAHELALVGALAPHLCVLRVRGLRVDATAMLQSEPLASRLEELVLEGLPWLGDGALAAVAAHAVRLRVLRIVGSSSSSSPVLVGVLRTAGAALRELALDDCAGADDALGRAIGEHCRALERLSLHNADVTDRSMCGAVTNLHALRHLRLSLTGVSCDTFRALAAAPCAPHLLSLDAAQLYNVTKDGVEALLGATEALEELSLAENDEVDDDTALLLTSACPAMRRLDLSLCDALSDQGLSQLVSDLDQLAVLRVVNCKGVTGRMKKRLEALLSNRRVDFAF